MGKLERDFQKNLIEQLTEELPGSIILKNDSSYKPGIPDITILYKGRWALLEAKKSENEPYQPGQEYYLKQAAEMSFSATIFPENKEEVLDGLYKALRVRR